MRVSQWRKIYRFAPRYSYGELLGHAPMGLRPTVIQDDGVLRSVEALCGKAVPSLQYDDEQQWDSFFVPLNRNGYAIVVPLLLSLYNGCFFLIFPCGGELEVSGGRDNDAFLSGLIEQTVAFVEIVKKSPEVVLKSLPLDIRTGRVLGRHVMRNVIAAERKNELMDAYEKHLADIREIESVSLNDYLEVAALCYRAAFGGKTEGMTPERMYKAWADGRHGGMLDIPEKGSAEAFRSWQRRYRGGAHPFEIVYSHADHGIHLYPPDEGRRFYEIRVSNYDYVPAFVSMLSALMAERIPVMAFALPDVLGFYAGESYFTVNKHGKHSFYFDWKADRKLIKHIEWDEPHMLRWL